MHACKFRNSGNENYWLVVLRSINLLDRGNEVKKREGAISFLAYYTVVFFPIKKKSKLSYKSISEKICAVFDDYKIGKQA